MANRTEIDEIKTEIQHLIDDNITTVQEVNKYWKTIFRGYPVVNIIFMGVENEFRSTAENLRTFQFRLQILEQVSQVPDGSIEDTAMERAEKIIDAVVSDMIDIFDQKYDSDDMDGTITYGLPSNTEPKVVAKMGNGQCLMQEINIRYNKLFNVT